MSINHDFILNETIVLLSWGYIRVTPSMKYDFSTNEIFLLSWGYILVSNRHIFKIETG